MNELAISPGDSGPKFHFVGGALCLDFCNTVGGKRGGVAREKLHSFEDFVSWAEQATLMNSEQAGGLKRFATGQPQKAAGVLTRAINLREAIFRIMFSASGGKRPTSEDLECLNAELAASLGRLRVGQTKDGFVWQWSDEELGPDFMLGPIARSAAELMVQNEAVAKVHQCEGDNCGWLFVDCSKNHSRRWCDMRDCGNRAKVRRHRKRRKA